MSQTPIQGEPIHRAVNIDENITINGSGYGKVYIADGAVTFYRKTKRWIKFQPYLKGTLFTPTARAIDSNTITYQGGKYFQARYEFWDDSLKEIITLKDAPQAQRFKLEDLSFLVTTSEGTHVEQQANGDLWLMRTDNPRCLMVIPLPTVTDALSAVYPVTWSYNESTKFLTISGSIAGATYPVTIDPSVEVDSAVDEMDYYGSYFSHGRVICRDEEDRIWTAWVDDTDVEVGYSDNNTSTWTKEEPFTGSSKESIHGIAIAVDGNRDVHLIVDRWLSADTPPGRIIYFKRTHSSSTWSSAYTIETYIIYEGGRAVDIAVDSNNYVHCLYTKGSHVKYIKYTTSWQSIEDTGVDTGGTTVDHRNLISITVDSSGYVHIIANKNEDSSRKLYYCKRTTSWGSVEEIASSTTNSFYQGGVCVDSSGNIHIMYKDSPTAGNTAYVYYRKRTTSWQSAETVLSYTGWESEVLHVQSSIMLDAAENPIVMYQDTNMDAAFKRKMADGSWGTAELCDSANSQSYLRMMWANYPKCASDKNSNIPIGGVLAAYMNIISSKYYWYAYQSKDFQPANTCQTVYSCQLGGKSNSIPELGSSCGRKTARAPNGRIWIVYLYDSDGYYLKAKYSDNGGKSWTETSITSSGVAEGCSIAIDGNGYVHVVYTRTVSVKEVKYKRWTGSSWETEEDITTGSSADQTVPAIAVDSSNYPHVVWRDGSFIIKYRYKTSGGWQTAETVIDGGSQQNGAPDIAFDGDSHVHATYVNLSGSQYVWHREKTTSWQTAEKCRDLSLAWTSSQVTIASDGTIYVAAYDDTNDIIHVFKSPFPQSGSDTASSTCSTAIKMASISVDQDNYVYLVYILLSGDVYLQKKTTSWGSEIQLTSQYSTLASFPPSLIWAWHPQSMKPNIPDTGAMGVFVAETISTSYRDVYVWKSSDLTWMSMIQKLLSVTETVGKSITTKLDLKRTLSVTETVWKQITKKGYKTLSQSAGSTATLLKAKFFTRLLSASTAPARTLLRKISKTLTRTSAPEATIGRLSKFYRTLSTSTQPARTLLRKISKTISATTTPTRTIQRMVTKTLSATTTPARTLLRKMFKTLDKQEVSNAVLTKWLNLKRTLSTSTTPNAVILRVARFFRTLTTSATSALTLIPTKIAGTYYKTLEIASAGTATLTKWLDLKRTLSITEVTDRSILRMITKPITRTATGTATLLRAMVLARLLSATTGPAATLKRGMYVLLSKAEVSTASLAKWLNLKRTLSTTTAPPATLSRLSMFYRTLSITSTAVRTLLRKITKTLTTSSGPTATITRITSRFRTLLSTAGSTASMLRITSRFRTLSISGTGTATLSRLAQFYRTITIASTAVLKLPRMISKSVLVTEVSDATLTGIRFFLRTLSATATGILSLVKQAAKVLSITEVVNTTLTRYLEIKRTLTATTAGVGTLLRQAVKILTSTAVSVATLTFIKTIRQQVTITAVCTSFLFRGMYKTLTTSSSGVATLTRVTTFFKMVVTTVVTIATLGTHTGPWLTAQTIEDDHIHLTWSD